MFKLRDYQSHGKNLTYTLIRQGKKQILYWLPTGGGKGLAMSDFAHDVTSRGKKCLVIMRRRELIFQTKINFEKYHRHNCSIIMGSEKGFDPTKNVQICSIDTLRNRDLDFLKSFDVVIIDECHDTNSQTYQRIIEFLGDKIFIGFTATPFTVGGKPLKFWQDVVQPIDAAEMRDRGFLSHDVTFAPAAQIDVRGLELSSTGDFRESDLFDRAKDNVIVGDIVRTWLEKGENRPTLLFCVNKEHSKLMTAAFILAGVPTIHVDESTTSEERKIAINKLKSGEIKILSSIGILTTGVDIPQVSCLIMARPTQSEVVYIQSVGRGLRPFKICGDCGLEFGAEKQCLKCKSENYKFEKDFCIILDHSGNVFRHGLPFDKRTAKLGETETKSKDGEKPDVAIKTCEQCFVVYSPQLECCPVCGTVSKTKNVIKEKSGELRLVDEETTRKFKLNKCHSSLQNLKLRQRWFNWKENAVWFKLHKECGDMIFEFEEQLGVPRWLKKVIKGNNL